MMKIRMTALALVAAMAAGGSVMAKETAKVPADMNNDGFVTREEFVDYMGKTWDENHARMMKSDPKMSADRMDGRQYQAFSSHMGIQGRMKGEPPAANPNPGKIGGATGSGTGAAK